MKDASVMRTVWEKIPSATKLQCSVMEFVKEAVAQRIIDTRHISNIYSFRSVDCVFGLYCDGGRCQRQKMLVSDMTVLYNKLSVVGRKLQQR
jgi:hypothetical protein